MEPLHISKEKSFPAVVFTATNGDQVNLSALSGRWVIYVYPMTGIALEQPCPRVGMMIPGARGCTPQSCSFRDHHDELKALNTGGLRIKYPGYGLSDRGSRPSASAFRIAERQFIGLKGRTQFAHIILLTGMELFKRLTLIAEHGTIQKVFLSCFSTRPKCGRCSGVVAAPRE